MSKKIMKNIPKLRFSEFVNNGEWEKNRFSKYIKLYRGSSPRPIQNYLTQSNIGVNWIKIGDTKNAINFKINKVEEKITLKGAEKSRKVKVGELILANSMSFGKTYELEINGCIYDGWFVLREYEEYFHKPFLLQFLNSEYMQKQYNKLSAGGIVQNISSQIVNQTILFHTSIQEQKKIADCLNSIDSLISAQSQKVELLKEHKNGLLQNLFPKDGENIPKIRFCEFKDSKKWEQKQLGILTKVIVGGTPSTIESSYWNDGIINWLSSGDINNGIIKQASKLITPLGLEKSSAKLMPPNTVVLAMTGATLGRIGYLSIETSGNQSVAGLIPNKEYNSKFLFYLLLKNTNTILSMAGGAAQAGINKATIESLEFYFPLINEQKKIADSLTSIDEEINLQIQKVELLKKHKKALLQQLFPSNEVING